MNKTYNKPTVNKASRLSAALAARSNLDNIKAFEFQDIDFCPFPTAEIEDCRNLVDSTHAKNNMSSLTRSSTPNSVTSNAFLGTPEREVTSLLTSSNISNTNTNNNAFMYYSNNNQKFPKVNNKQYSPQRTFNNTNNGNSNASGFTEEHYKQESSIQGNYYYARANVTNNGNIMINPTNSNSAAIPSITNTVNYQQFNNFGNMNRNKYNNNNATPMINNRPRSKVYGYSK